MATIDSYTTHYQHITPNTAQQYQTHLSTITPAPIFNTAALPSIPPPSRLEDFGVISRADTLPVVSESVLAGTYVNKVTTSQTPMGESLGLTHSMFPLSQPGTYQSYHYTPNTPTTVTTATSSSGTPPWVWALLFCILLGIGLAVGLYYWNLNNSISATTLPTAPPVSSVVSQRQVTTSTTETVSPRPVTNIGYTTSVSSRQTEEVDESHHSHLRHLIY